MKSLNTLLLLVFCLVASTLTAQQEARIMQLSRDIEGVAKTTRISPADRETKVINLIGEYLSEVRLKNSSNNTSKRNNIEEPSEESDFLKSFSSSRGYDKEKVKEYLQTIDRRNRGAQKVSNSIVSSLGNIRTDNNLKAAVRIYEEVGSENLSFEQNDEVGTETSESRRFGGNYKYTGTKRYFFWYGWRYKCDRYVPQFGNGCKGAIKSYGTWRTYRGVDCWR